IGDIGKIDERTDVFALGATLCEILTGLPAYAGTDGEVLALAHSGDTTHACRRLEQSDADPELVALAKQCLHRDVGSRARAARVVAERITSHLAEAERRAERARAHMISARRAARLTHALAAAVVLMIALGAGWWSYARRQQGASEFRIELDRARNLRLSSYKD